MLSLAIASLQVEHYITLGGILAPCVTAVSTLLLAWWLKRIDNKAGRAVKLAQPSGNGFTAEVTEALARIEERQVKVEERQMLTDRRLETVAEELHSHLRK